jgi:hypothetical protein
MFLQLPALHILFPTTSLSHCLPRKNFQAGDTIIDSASCNLTTLSSFCPLERVLLDIPCMYCLTRTHGRARGGSSKILDAVAANEPGGANMTLNYFWLTMISLAWATHAAALGPAATPHFGMTVLSADDRSHGVSLPSATLEVTFAEFMSLPQSGLLGAVLELKLLFCNISKLPTSHSPGDTVYR